jgi:very-short-patch-repair endonuclease
MSRLRASIRNLGGVAATHELHALGFTREQLRLATREREIRRIRQGWYIDPDTPEAVADCLRVGGRASCVTAAEHLGLWVVERSRDPHVTVRPNACQLRDPGDYRRRIPLERAAVVHWTDHDWGGARTHVGVEQLIYDIALCQGIEHAFVAAESAFARSLLTRAAWNKVCDALPIALGAALRRASAGSGSITESVFTFRTMKIGVRIRRQVTIGIDRVDFVLGERLVIEIDSKQFHERERDYARDARLGALGYRVLRFTYRQVMHDWPAVESALLAAIARGDAA